MLLNTPDCQAGQQAPAFTLVESVKNRYNLCLY